MYFPQAATRKQLNESVLDIPSKSLGRTLPKVGSYTLPKIPIATAKAAFSPRLPSLLQQDSSKKVYLAFCYLFHIVNYFHPIALQMLMINFMLHSGLGHRNYGKSYIIQPKISIWRWLRACQRRTNKENQTASKPSGLQHIFPGEASPKPSSLL